MSDIDVLIENVTDGLAEDAKMVERGLVDGLLLRLDRDFACLQAARRREKSLRKKMRKAEQATEIADARYKQSQQLCTAAQMIGLRGTPLPFLDDPEDD